MENILELELCDGFPWGWERDYHNVAIALVWIFSVERRLTNKVSGTSMCDSVFAADLVFFFFFSPLFLEAALVLWHRPRSSFDIKADVSFSQTRRRFHTSSSSWSWRVFFFFFFSWMCFSLTQNEWLVRCSWQQESEQRHFVNVCASTFKDDTFCQFLFH